MHARGLNYTSEKYFTERYVLTQQQYDKHKFTLPKKKEHWKIICEFIGISGSDMFQSWISYYGRKQMNEIKNIYQYILSLCIDQNYLSEIENPAFRKQVSAFLETKMYVFNDADEKISPTELANSIISSIVNELTFQEVAQLKNILHE